MSQTVAYNREYEQRTNNIYFSILWDLEMLRRPNWESTQLTSIGKRPLNGPYKVWLIPWQTIAFSWKKSLVYLCVWYELAVKEKGGKSALHGFYLLFIAVAKIYWAFFEHRALHTYMVPPWGVENFCFGASEKCAVEYCHFNPLSNNPRKRSNTQTIADKLFECVRPFYGIGA